MTTDCFVVTIDGPGGAGKSTTARLVAGELGFGYLDTGAIYRSVALCALERGLDLDDGAAVAELATSLDIEMPPGTGAVLIDGEDVSGRIRTPEISEAASRVSALPALRKVLVALQRAAARAPGTVAEGRDMGTVIFPDAGLKIFLDADQNERARRRTEELRERTGDAGLDQGDVKRDLAERDRRDSTREVAPLGAAPDAVTIDSTYLAVDEVVARIVKVARLRRSPR